MFKKSRTIWLVVDEYGGEGLITLNDILEDLVGDVASVDMPGIKSINVRMVPGLSTAVADRRTERSVKDCTIAGENRSARPSADR
jgi:Mg2+/Co2+ transporter CorB